MSLAQSQGIQQLNQWKTINSAYLTPIVSGYGLLIPGIASSSTGCLSIASNGWISANGSACGSGSGGGISDPFTHPAYGGSATSSLLTLTGGLLINNASSTIVGNATTTGNFSVGSLTLAGTRFTNANISQWTNNAGYLTSLAGAASSTLLGDTNTWSALQRFNGNASTTELTTGYFYIGSTTPNDAISTSTYAFFQDNTEILNVQRTGGVDQSFSLIQLNGKYESTITHKLTGAIGTEFSDWYDEEYPNGTQLVGIRIQKRGAGLFKPFSLDFFDGVTISPGLYVSSSTQALGVATTSVSRGRVNIQQSANTSSSGIALLTANGSASARLWADVNGNPRLDAGASATGNVILNGSGTGKVGVIQASPTYTFDVTGPGHFTSYVDASIFIATSTTLASSFPFASSTALTAANFASTNATSSNLTLTGAAANCNGTNALTTSSTGVVGCTAQPQGTVTGVTGAYPVLSSGGATPAISLAFGTTTSNTWANTQTFTNPIVDGTLSGLIAGNTGVTYATATGTITGSTGLTVTANQYIIGSGLTITNTGVTSNVAGAGIAVSGATGAVTISSALSDPFPNNATSTTLSFNLGLLSIGSTTFNGNATTTGTLYANIASSTKLFGAGLGSCTGGTNALTWSGGTFGCNSIAASGSVGNWFTPTTFGASAANATSTLTGFTQGLYALATSTIGDSTQIGGLTISGGATTTLNAYFNANVGIGTTSPWALVGINATANAASSPLFNIGSSSKSYFTVNSAGGIELSGIQPATSTAIVLNWANTPRQVEYRIGSAATTITFINATTSRFWTSVKLVYVCNPGQAAGALTWAGVEWVGSAPTQTTTANQCDVYSFNVTAGTSTGTTFKVAGTAGVGFQ